MNKICKKPLTSELNTKNTLISLMVVVKDLKVLRGSGDGLVKQKLVVLRPRPISRTTTLKQGIQSLRSVRIVSVRERRGNEKLPKYLVRTSSIIHAELNFLYISMTYGRLFL